MGSVTSIPLPPKMHLATHTLTNKTLCTIPGTAQKWSVEKVQSRLISMLSGETPWGRGIHLAEGSSKGGVGCRQWPAARLGSPGVPCGEEARGKRPSWLNLSSQAVAAVVLGAMLTKAPWMRAKQADLGASPRQQLLLHGNPQLQGYVGTAIPSMYPWVTSLGIWGEGGRKGRSKPETMAQVGPLSKGGRLPSWSPVHVYF